MGILELLLVPVLLPHVCYTFSVQLSIRAEPGQNVVLPCRVATGGVIKVVDWTRDDLGSYRVLLYRSSQFVSDQQHPSLRNRVDLQDRQMKDGNVSLVLKNPTAEDSGTYRCQIVQSGTKNRDSNPNCIIRLDVARESRVFRDGGTRTGPSGPVIGPTVLLLLLLLLLLFTD